MIENTLEPKKMTKITIKPQKQHKNQNIFKTPNTIEIDLKPPK